MEHRITDAANARAFMLAGNATFTIVSTSTKVRYTFRVRTKESDDGTPATGTDAGYWVRTLVGADNENDYVGCGFLSTGRDVPRYFPGKSRGKAQAGAFEWLARQLFAACNATGRGGGWPTAGVRRVRPLRPSPHRPQLDSIGLWARVHQQGRLRRQLTPATLRIASNAPAMLARPSAECLAT